MFRILYYGLSNTRNCCYYRILTNFEFKGFKTKKLEVIPMKTIDKIFCINNKTKLDKNQLKYFKLALYETFLKQKRF